MSRLGTMFKAWPLTAVWLLSLMTLLVWYEVGGTRAGIDEETRRYLAAWDEKAEARDGNVTRYYDGHGTEITRAQAYNREPTGFIGRHLDGLLGMKTLWLLILAPLAVAAYRAWGKLPVPSKAWMNLYWFFAAIIILELILTLYLVDWVTRDPLADMVRVDGPTPTYGCPGYSFTCGGEDLASPQAAPS